MQSTITRLDVAASAIAFGATAELAHAVSRSLASADRAPHIGVSGHFGSGKDTIAPAVLDALDVPAERRVHVSFAQALKGEVRQVLAIVASATSQAGAVQDVAGAMSIDEQLSATVVDGLWDAVQARPDLAPEDRTPVVRRALQLWGTEVRRARDADYWVKQAVLAMLPHVAEGQSVYMTDPRFPNEADALLQFGFKVVRLEITDATQRGRLMSRDGLSEEAYLAHVTHASETSLDDFARFDLVVDNNGGVDSIPHVVATIANLFA
jgi:hypothetical protein